MVEEKESVEPDLLGLAQQIRLNMLAAAAKMERDLLIERIQSGLARAKAEGKTLGRKPKTTHEQQAQISTKYSQGVSVSGLASHVGGLGAH
jgi:DNA invertase Pin-like site-specific DNA recombinase